MVRSSLAILMSLLVVLTGSISAAPSNEGTFFGAKKTGVVLMGDPLFRDHQFYLLVEEKIKSRFINLVVGDEPQGLYKKFWSDKGLLQEPAPTKQDITAFAKVSPYDQMLFIVVSPPTVIITRGEVLIFHQATVPFRAILVDKQTMDIISDQETTQAGWSSYNGLNSSLRGAFKQAMEYFLKSL